MQAASELKPTVSEDSHAGSSPRRRRYGPWVWVALLLAGVGWFGRFAYLRITLKPTPRVAYWDEQLRQGQPVVSQKQMDAVYEAITDRPFETTFPVTLFTEFDVSELLGQRRWRNLPYELTAALVFRTPSFTSGRTRLKAAVAQPWAFEVSVDPFSRIRSPHHDARAWTRWLVVHSLFARLRGETRTAAEDWILTYQLAGRLREQPDLISKLVASAVESLTSQEMILASRETLGGVDVPALVRTVDTLLARDITPEQILRPDVLGVMSLMEHFYVREGGDWLDLSERARLHSLWTSATAINPPRAWNLMSPLYHDLATARRNVERYFHSWDDCRDWAAVERTSSRVEEVLPTVLDGWIDTFSGLGRALSIEYRARCETEAALTSLALHEYRRRHGEYPGTLQQLVPDIMPRLPIDWADRQPLRYRREGAGYILYSVGPDGVDDGGVGDSNASHYPTNEQKPDIVYSRMHRWASP